MEPSEDTDIFKERLKSVRELRGLSQNQLATNSGLPPSSVSHFEAGARKPSLDNLKRIAVALDVTTDYLLGRSDTPEASATAAQLHRDLHKLTSDDLKLAEDFIDILVKRGGQAKG